MLKKNTTFVANKKEKNDKLMRLFKKDVALQSILYILNALGGRSDMHKICKILYFADQLHLSTYSRSITGDAYIAMQFGPVPSKIDDIFKAVRGDSYFSDTEFAEELKSYFHFVNKYTISADKPTNMDYLSQSDVECLDASIAKCKDKSFGALTELSHGMAWQNTQRDRKMSVKDILREIGDDEGYVDYIGKKLDSESYNFI